MNHYQQHIFSLAVPVKPSTKLKGLSREYWTFLSFLLPFVICGTIFAAMPISDVLHHPPSRPIHDIIAAIWVGYATMGISCGAAGVCLLYMYRDAKNFCLGKK